MNNPSNFPPGVTGNEPQITGEFDKLNMMDRVWATCEHTVESYSDLTVRMFDIMTDEQVRQLYEETVTEIEALKAQPTYCPACRVKDHDTCSMDPTCPCCQETIQQMKEMP